MPWIEITCACGCGRSKRAYWQPSSYRPKFFSRECLKSPPPDTASKKWLFTPVMDLAIGRVWRTVSPGHRHATLLKEQPEFRGIPKYMIHYRARRLGLVAPKADTAWSLEEDEILEAFGGELSVEQIRRKLKRRGHRRSLAAIAARLYKRYRRGVTGETLTAMDVARMLGWEWHVIVRWIEKGRLKGFRGGPNGRRWRIHKADLARFIQDEAELLSQRRVDLVVMIPLLDAHPAADDLPRKSRLPQISSVLPP